MLKSFCCVVLVFGVILAVQSEDPPPTTPPTQTTVKENIVQFNRYNNNDNSTDVKVNSTIDTVVGVTHNDNPNPTTEQVNLTTTEIENSTTVNGSLTINKGNSSNDISTTMSTPVINSDSPFSPNFIKAGSCISCNQSSRSICLKPSKNETSKNCGIYNKSQCYTKLHSDGFIERGCADQLKPNDCNKTSIDCTQCSGDNCNNKDYPNHRLSCHFCDSSNKNCSLNHEKDIPKLCPKYVKNDKCFISNYKGSYERGCLSGDKHRCKTLKCFECNTNGCNNGLYNSANGHYSVATMISFMFFTFTMVLVN